MMSAAFRHAVSSPFGIAVECPEMDEMLTIVTRGRARTAGAISFMSGSLSKVIRSSCRTGLHPRETEPGQRGAALFTRMSMAPEFLHGASPMPI